MKINDLDISIKEYLGRIGPGISVVVSIKHKEVFYEGMYWYTDKEQVIEIEEPLRNEIGNIEEHPSYDEVLEYLKKTCPNYLETVDKFKDIFS